MLTPRSFIKYTILEPNSRTLTALTMIETGNLMKFLQFIVGIIALFLSVQSANAEQYEIRKVSDNVYAAIAQSQGKVVSNAVFIITDYEVILAGAHFINEGVNELLKQVSQITNLPVTQVILTHHHKGFNYVDFDLPEKAEVIVSVNTLQALKGEHREFKNPTLVFEENLTLNRGKTSIVIMDTGPGHSSGDLIVYLPKEGILFASDLLFNDAVGYMGDASVHEWGESLELLEKLAPLKVVPGVGKVDDVSAITRFRKFYQAFMTEVIRNVEKGNTLAQTRKEFSLEQYSALPGFRSFLDVNLERAYRQLKSQR
jgi:glyoxylase-like metal-dependent hydrolase (beta-lactamase superfamily II)